MLVFGQLLALAYYFIPQFNVIYFFLQENQYRDFITELPHSVVKHILSYLGPAAMAKLSMVNHAYYQFIDNLKISTDTSTVTRLIELDNPMPNIPSFQKAYAELKSRDNYKSGKYCRVTDLESNQGRIHCVTLYRRYIAAGGSDKTIKVWAINTGKHVVTFTGHQAGIWCLQFFSSHILVSASHDSTVRIWSIKRSRCLRELRGHSGPVWSVRAYGNVLLTGSQDKTVNSLQCRSEVYTNEQFFNRQLFGMLFAANQFIIFKGIKRQFLLLT